MHRLSAAERPPPAVELWSDQTPFASPPIDDIRIRLFSACQPTGLWPDRHIAAQSAAVASSALPATSAVTN